MTRSYPKSSQIANDAALETLGTSAETPLDTLFSKLAQEVEFPYRLHAAATPDVNLYITASAQQTASGSQEVWSLSPTSITSFSSGYVDFQARAYSANITITFPASTVGYYRLCVFSVLPDGTIQANFTAENAVLNNLTDPLSVAPVNNHIVGWVQLECTNAAGEFKTAGSATNVIENIVGSDSRIFHFVDKSQLRIVSSSVNPTTSDDDYKVGTIWADSTSKRSFLLLNNTPSSADWRELVYNGGNESALTIGTNTSAALTFETVNTEAGNISTSQIWTIGPVAGGVTHVIRGALSVDTIYEKTATSGVTVDGVFLKDGSAQNTEFYGAEPGSVSSSTSGQAGTAVTASRSDHNHDLGAHTHADSTSGGLIEAASATQQGSVTTSTQTFAGIKTFSSNPVFSAMATAGLVHNAADGSTSTSLLVNADVDGSAAIDGSKIVAATALVPGVVTTTTQTFAGIKTFSSNPVFSAMATAGLVHNAADGSTSTSLLVNADVDAAAAIDGSKIVAATALVPGVVTTGTQTFAGTKTFSNDVVITGDLTVNGNTTTVNTSTLAVEDNQIVLNNGEVGAGVTAGKAGILVDRGSETDYEFVFQESDDTFRIGVLGSTQAVATRQDTPTANGISYWNSTDYRFDTSTSLTWNESETRLYTSKIRLSQSLIEFNGLTSYLSYDGSDLKLRLGGSDYFMIQPSSNNIYFGPNNTPGSVFVRTSSMTIVGTSGGFADLNLKQYGAGGDSYRLALSNVTPAFSLSSTASSVNRTHISIPYATYMEIGANGNYIHKVMGTGALGLPSGSNTDRSGLTPTTGNIRFNTTGSVIEYYTGSAWVNAASEAYAVTAADSSAIKYSIVFG